MLTILGVNFYGGSEALEKQGRNFCGKNLPSKFAEQFASTFPKKICKTKIENSPQIHSAEPRDPANTCSMHDGASGSLVPWPCAAIVNHYRGEVAALCAQQKGLRGSSSRPAPPTLDWRPPKST